MGKASGCSLAMGPLLAIEDVFAFDTVVLCILASGLIWPGLVWPCLVRLLSCFSSRGILGVSRVRISSSVRRAWFSGVFVFSAQVFIM